MMHSEMTCFDGRDGWMSAGSSFTAFTIVDSIAFPLTVTIIVIIINTTTSWRIIDTITSRWRNSFVATSLVGYSTCRWCSPWRLPSIPLYVHEQNNGERKRNKWFQWVRKIHDCTNHSLICTFRRIASSSWNERTSCGVATSAIPPKAIQPYRAGSSNDKLIQFSS